MLGLFISKVIFSGIDYVQDFVPHGLMAIIDIYCSEKGYTSSLWSKENTEIIIDILQKIISVRSPS